MKCVDEMGYERFKATHTDYLICDECGAVIFEGDIYDQFGEEIFCEECI